MFDNCGRHICSIIFWVAWDNEYFLEWKVTMDYFLFATLSHVIVILKFYQYGVAADSTSEKL